MLQGSPTPPVRVLLADDHPFYRAGLRGMLEQGGIDVVGEACDGDQSVSMARKLHPDVVLMDLSMPRLSGAEATREIVASTPDVRILVISASAEEADLMRAIAAGACGYLLKDTAGDEIVSAILETARGSSVMSAGIAGHMLERLRSQPSGGAPPSTDGAALTPREVEVLRLVAEGADNASIGHSLYISRHTVKQHVANICEKLEVKSRVQAAVRGVRSGLI